MIFYCEARIFSGQERMFLTAACEHSHKKKCILIINKVNHDAISFCKENGNFYEFKEVENFDQKFSSLLIWFRWARIHYLYNYLKNKKNLHSTFCVSQGRIESGNIGVIAAKVAGMNVISYIPMVHDHAEMGSIGIGAKIKDILCIPLYKLPNSYITISAEVARDLAKKTNAEIKVVENFVSHRKLVKLDNPPPFIYDESYYKLIIPGRLLNKQKGQLDLIKAVKELDAHDIRRIICYIVGDGPDKGIITSAIKENNLNDNIYVLGNRNDLPSIMNECDLVVLPSRFEGVPLVLLEAAVLEKDIIASDIVGFNNYLSVSDVFEPNSPSAISKKILSKIKGDSPKAKYTKSLKNLISRDHEMFKSDFSSALNSLSSE